MRPLKLEIEGFTAFKDLVTLDMEDLDLFAITGPTGAGKSSLIDAICYALYGKVPRVANEVTSCISQDRDRMRVTYEFSAADERYRIFRETRRKGAPNVRLERCAGGDWLAVVDRARDVSEKVSEIVGLDYEGFTRSVILPQGQFQEFLAGSAEKRRAVLGSLLRLEVYERMRKRASTMSGETKFKLDERKHTLEALAEATPENLQRLEAERASAVSQIEVLKGTLESLDGAIVLAMTLNRAREGVTKCEDEARSALGEYDRTRRVLEEGDAGLEKLIEAEQTLQKRLAENAYEPEMHTALGIALERVKALSQSKTNVDDVARKHSDASKQATNAGTAAEKAKTAHEAAEQALAFAATAYEEAQRHNLAASLQQGLKPGDACPVCGEKIGELVTYVASDLDAAAKKLAAARKAEADARNSFMTASNAATKAASSAEGYAAQLDTLRTRLTEQEASVVEVLPDGISASVEALSRALTAQVAARSDRQAVERDLKATLEQLQAKQAAREEATRRLAALEQRSGAAADALDAAEQALSQASDALGAAIGEAWPDVSAAQRDGRDASVLLRRSQVEAQGQRDELQTRVGQIGARLEQLAKDIERAKELREGMQALQKELDVSTDLAQMLGAAKFQTFLQYEAMLTLARDGSKRLEQLSSGRYRLRVDDRGAEFEVIDQWNADQARSVKTLSGGETFLASLALSLALAESLPGLAASRRVVLDSIFLDEGFGSLDADALDRAAEALDALRTENRMVCIVTHLQELAQRLPARVVVTKAESGSTVAIA
ncbi:MAG TPA: SMC family ATPase [Dehalococcoidia bacterium]|nr:SMC family ATPase [Dehalococcoidia bacterium]